MVSEGECTEPQYIVGYEQLVRNASVYIEVARERGEPKKVVEIAKAQKGWAAAEAKRRGDPWLDFDEVWCVFDRDSHERFDEAIQMARDNGFHLAVSNPCIELWLLLHFRDSPGAREREDLHRMLRKRLLPGYDKHLDFALFEDHVETACTRARRLDQQAEARGDPPYGNPSTGFYRLLESIARVEDSP